MENRLESTYFEVHSEVNGKRLLKPGFDKNAWNFEQFENLQGSSLRVGHNSDVAIITQRGVHPPRRAIRPSKKNT